MLYKLYLARFPYKGAEESTVTDYLAKLVHQLKSNSDIAEIRTKNFDDTPITMTRNLAAKCALACGSDYLLMIDSDMAPDVELLAGDPMAKPFWESSMEFLLGLREPAAIGAPYCGPPPCENVFVFKPANFESDCPPGQLKIDQYNREEAFQRAGIEEVAALPTGLIIFDMRIFKIVPPTWFEYEYADPPFNTAKATTEDVFLTRNAALCGVRQYCNWDAWAGHWKRKCVRKPRPFTMDFVRENLRAAVARGIVRDEKLITVGEGDESQPPIAA